MYLYIHEDGTILKSKVAPTEQDIDSIDAGVLSVIVTLEANFTVDLKQYSCDGSIIDIPEVKESQSND